MEKGPISPHLQIYKIQITSFFSILHRLTGIFLFVLLIIFSWYFILHFYFPDLLIFKYLDFFFLSVALSKLIYTIIFMSFLYHFFNGIRHLLWDFGFNLEIDSVLKSAILLVITLFLFTIFFILIFII